MYFFIIYIIILNIQPHYLSSWWGCQGKKDCYKQWGSQDREGLDSDLALFLQQTMVSMRMNNKRKQSLHPDLYTLFPKRPQWERTLELIAQSCSSNQCFGGVGRLFPDQARQVLIEGPTDEFVAWMKYKIAFQSAAQFPTLCCAICL